MGTLALAYEPPTVAWAGEVATEHSGLWWVVWVLLYATALTWASYCVYKGGSPEIEFSWFKWKVACYR